MILFEFKVCHRELTKVIPSFSRLELSIHKRYIAPEMLAPPITGHATWVLLKRLLLNLDSWRRESGNQQGRLSFRDIQYTELVKSPIDTVSKLYTESPWGASTHFAPPTEDLVERWKEYLGNNKQGHKGRAEYSLEDFGLSGEELLSFQKTLIIGPQ